jgi:LysM repeat protein
MYNKMMPTNTSYLQYVVQPNDSLYMIAKAYNSNVEDIKKLNNLVSNTIYPNQLLLIPTSTHKKQTYITKGGYKHTNKKFVRETSIRIELLFTTDIQVQIIANRLKKHFNQESIAHEKITTNSELI